MPIIQRPDTLSLSGNLKDFRIASDTQVSFTLRQGDEPILSQTYDPGDDGIISISLRNIITGRLSFLLKETTDITEFYEQPNLAAEFTAIIDSETVTFTVIRAGVDNLADTPSNFLKNNFLTWQPQTKHVTYSSPEYLTYYAVIPCHIILKAYAFTDTPEGTVTNERSTSLLTLEPGQAFTFPMQYAAVSAHFDNILPAFYDVWIENFSGERITYIQRYVADGFKSHQEQWILFENSLGGLDTFRAYGSDTFTGKHTHNIAQIEDEACEYRIDTEREHAQNTGHLNAHERRWLLDFFPSATKYIFENNTLRRIVVTESNVTYTDKELPSNYTFTYKHADARPFLNLPRSSVPAPGEDLNIVIPDLGSFTVPPRLVEFPHLLLTEGALLPVQSPYTEQWNVTTIGAVFEYISERFTGAGGGSGSNTGLLDERYLRKDRDDIAAGNIAFVKSARSAIYLDGMDGKGWGIDATGDVIFDTARIREDLYIGGKFGSVAYASGFTGFGIQIDTADASETLDHLTVRKTMQVYELVYSQIYGLGGSVIISDLNKIASVELLSDGETYRCTIDTMDDTMRLNLRPGDIVRMQRSSGINLRYFYAQVTNTSNVPNVPNAPTFDLKILEGLDTPAPGDTVFRFGSTTDPNRRGILYLTSSDDHAPYIDILDGITGPSLQNKTKARLGNLSGIRTQSGVNLSGYGLYAQGAVFENSDIYLADGNRIEQWFSIYDGKLNSAISSVLDDMSGQEGNILRNSSFYKNLHYWTSENLVNFINLGDGDPYLWIDTFYVEKQNIADIFYDGTRNVLRIKNTTLKQTNDLFLGHPLQEGTHSLAFYYKVLTPGTLTFGFDAHDLYRSEQLPVSYKYEKRYVEEPWDGTGDFQISFTGEILLYGLTLRADTLSDAIVQMQTQITQTHEQIQLLATKDYVDSETGDIYAHYDASLTVMAEGISATANRISALEHASAGWLTTADGNKLWASKEILDEMGNTVASHSSDITQLADRITSTVSSVNALTGEELVSRINQTADAITIEASKINLTGAITANGNVFINPDGTLVAKGGRFNGYLSFPFKNLEDSDATKNQGAGTWKLNQDVNLVADSAAQSTCTILLPSNTAFNGVLVNIFRPTRRITYSDGTVQVKTEDGSPLCTNYATSGLDSLTLVSSVEVSGALLQFLCVVTNSTPYWVLLGKQA